MISYGRLFFLIFFLTVSISHANVLGTDAQNFNTNIDGLDFVTVHSSETLTRGVLNIGFFSTYAQNTFAHITKENSSGNFQDGMTSAELSAGFGVSRNFELGLGLPMMLNSWDNGGDSDHIQLQEGGLTAVRLHSKYHILGDRLSGLAFVGSIDYGLIKNNPYSGDRAGPTYDMEVAADKTFGKIAVGGNLGYRIRSPGTKIVGFPIEPYHNQFIASTAVSYLFAGTATKVISEIYGAWPAQSQTLSTDRSATSFEIIAGLKHDLTRALSIHGGGGTRLTRGVASPDWRVYAGLNYAIGPLFGDPPPLIRKVQPQYKNFAEDDSDEPITPFWEEPTETQERFVVNEVLFAFNSDQISNVGARDALAYFAEHVEKPPRYKLVVIEGHTDSIGKASYNQDLSQRRANNIRNYLIENNGLDPDRVRAIGYGETQPIADNGNYQGRAKNRRVEFKIYREGSDIPEEYEQQFRHQILEPKKKTESSRVSPTPQKAAPQKATPKTKGATSRTQKKSSAKKRGR